METRNLERIRFITQHFNNLQGLRYLVPLGLIALGWGGSPLLRTLLSLAALLLSLGAWRYYRDAFGQVEQPPVDLTAELYPVSVFSPAGPLSRLEGFQQVPSFLRRFFATLALAVVLFIYFQSIPPNFLVQGEESLGQHPQVLVEPAPHYGPPLIKVLDGGVARSPSMLRAVSAQTMYVLCGSLFLSVWLWRKRHASQSHHLAFAVLLLGLSALGTSLGYLARSDAALPSLIDLVLPALVYPGLALLLCGSSLVLTGLLDHWQLVRTLGQPTAAGEEGQP